MRAAKIFAEKKLKRLDVEVSFSSHLASTKAAYLPKLKKTLHNPPPEHTLHKTQKASAPGKILKSIRRSNVTDAVDILPVFPRNIGTDLGWRIMQNVITSQAVRVFATYLSSHREEFADSHFSAVSSYKK